MEPRVSPRQEDGGASGTRREVRLTREQREATFLDAAAEILVNKGIDGLTMEGLARQAGVSKAIPYRFFGNSESVLLALYDRESRLNDELLAIAVEQADGLEAKLRAAAGVWIDPDRNKFTVHHGRRQWTEALSA